jgi:hypothetical protein
MHMTVGRPGKAILQAIDTYLAEANLNAVHSWQQEYVMFGHRACGGVYSGPDIKRPQSPVSPFRAFLSD